MMMAAPIAGAGRFDVEAPQALRNTRTLHERHVA